MTAYFLKTKINKRKIDYFFFYFLFICVTETGNKSSVNMVRNMVLRRVIQGSEFTPELLRILANDTEKGMSSSLRNQKDEKGL